jgi:hypothetical protein
MLKAIQKDPEFKSNDEIEEVIASARNALTFNDLQSVVHNWISRLVWIVEDSGEPTIA